jgi:hypothetical protein
MCHSVLIRPGRLVASNSIGGSPEEHNELRESTAQALPRIEIQLSLLIRCFEIRLGEHCV